MHTEDSKRLDHPCNVSGPQGVYTRPQIKQPSCQPKLVYDLSPVTINILTGLLLLQHEVGA